MIPLIVLAAVLAIVALRFAVASVSLRRENAWLRTRLQRREFPTADDLARAETIRSLRLAAAAHGERGHTGSMILCLRSAEELEDGASA